MVASRVPMKSMRLPSSVAVLTILSLVGAPPDIAPLQSRPGATRPSEDPVAPEASRVREFLQQANTHTRAHGAWLAGRFGLTSLTGELLKLVAVAEMGDPKKYDPSRDHALDALVRLGSNVPAAHFFSAADERNFDTQLLLLSRNTAKNADYILQLASLGETGAQHQFAAARLLAGAGDTRIAAPLLRQMQFSIYVNLFSPGDDTTNVSTGGLGGGARAWSSPHNQQTPRFNYHFMTNPLPGSVCVAGGDLPVFYRRDENYRSGSAAFPASQRLRTMLALEALSSLAKSRNTSFEFEAAEAVAMTTENPEADPATIAKIRERFIQRYESALDALERSGILTAAERAGLQPVVNIEIVDMRSPAASRPAPVEGK